MRLDLAGHNRNGQDDKSSPGNLLLTVSRSRLASSVALCLHFMPCLGVVSLRSSLPLSSIYIFNLKRDTKTCMPIVEAASPRLETKINCMVI